MNAAITPWLVAHFEWDILLWVWFFVGQCLYILKRSAMAIRSKMNPIKTRRQYLYQNWDILLIRMAIEWAIVYYPWRHGDLPAIFSHFGWTVPFKIPDGGFTAAGLGYLSDSGLDWFSTWSKAPSWIRENIPQVPLVIQTTEQTVKTEVHTTTLDINPDEGAKK